MPVDALTLLAFVPAALALVLTPGADMMFSLAQGLRGGRRAAVAAAAGASTGTMVNAALAGAGLGAVVAAAPALFDAIRWAGVAYLLWLALRTLRAPLGAAVGGAPVRPARAFRDGLVVNVSNPKVILFLLAFVPQFVDPSGAILPQFLVLGGFVALSGFVVLALVGALAGGVGRTRARSPRIERAMRWATAGVFGGLAVRLALQERAP